MQVHLARIYARLEFLKLINWKVAWTATQGHLDVADASTTKVFGTEFYMEAFKLLMEVVGQAGYLTRGSPEAVLAGRLEIVRPQPGHPDLRRRHQRDPAGPDRHLRPRPAPVTALDPRPQHDERQRRNDMDFSFNEEQEAVRDLADRIFTDLSTHERLRELESEPDGDRFDRKLWAELAAAGLLGIALPEDVGGAGLGFLETGLIVEAAGESAAYVPVIETAGRGGPGHRPLRHRGPAPALAPRRGGRRHRAHHGAGRAGWHARRPRRWWPSRTATAGRSPAPRPACPPGCSPMPCWCRPGWSPDSVAVFIVDTAARRCEPPAPDRQHRPARGRPHPGGRPGRARRPAGLGRRGRVDHRVAGAADHGGGGPGPGRCGRGRLALVAEYTKTREQFGKPIATFQAVGQRAADAYVDTEAIRLTAWQAAWRLAEGLPADKEVAVAKFWAADGGQRVVHAAVHLHGGVGVDRDYPLHRYFLMTKHFELTLGGATDQLLQLGAILAAEPV